MFRGLFFASVATIMVGYAELATATLMSEVSENLPSSFAPSGHANNGKHSYFGRKPIPGNISLSEDSEIFSITKLVQGSFNNATSDALSELPYGKSIPRIEELIALASLTPEILGPSSRNFGTDIPGSNNSTYSDATVEDLMKALVNRPTQPAPRKTRRQNDRGSGIGFALLTTVLESQLDQDFIDAAANVVNPSIDIGGVVTLKIFGLREIAFLMSPVTNQIQVMDLRTNRSISLNHTENQESIRHQNKIEQNRAQRVIYQNTDRTFSTVKWFKAAKLFVTEIVLHPFTLAVAFVFLMVISFRRMGQSA